MRFRTATLGLLFGGLLSLCDPAGAQNISLGKPYRYDINIPGQDSVRDDNLNFYQDDFLGVHDVYTTPTAFDGGDLTDGELGDGANDARVPSAIIAIWKGAAANPPLPVDITFDLGAPFSISQITIGTSLRGDNGQFGNFAPDDVSISFSSDNITYSTPENFTLWQITETLGLGHHELALAATSASAQFVKLSFDGQETEKYVLDEVTIEGVEAGLAPFQITEVQLLPDDQIQLTWNSRPGKVYTVFYSTDLTDFGSDAGDDYESGGETTVAVIDSSLAPIGTAPELFFKVSENE